MNKKAYLFIGASGCGKDTQMDLLLEHFSDKSVVLYGIGDLLRKFVADNNNVISKKVKKTLEEGGLLPSFLPVYVWVNKINQTIDDTDIFIFNGVRRLYEAQILARALEYIGLEKFCVIHLYISEEESIRRLLLRGRYDDKEELIKNRYGWFRKEVCPTIDFFEKYSKTSDVVKFHELDGALPVEEIHKNILKIV